MLPKIFSRTSADADQIQIQTQPSSSLPSLEEIAGTEELAEVQGDSTASSSSSNRGEMSESNSGSSLSSWLGRDDAFKLVAEEMYWQIKRERLFTEASFVPNGVAIRVAKANYVSYPPEDVRLQPWIQALHQLNCEATFTLTSSVAAGICASLAPGTHEVALTAEDRFQVVETMQSVAKARRAQGACFVRTQGCLIVWSDTVQDLLAAGKSLEEKMVRYIWRLAKSTQPEETGLPSGVTTAANSSTATSSAPSVHDERVQTPEPVTEKPAGKRLGSLFNLKRNTLHHSKSSLSASSLTDAKSAVDEKSSDIFAVVTQLESGEATLQSDRSINVLAAIYTGLALGLNIFIMGLFVRTLLLEALLDGNYLRMAIAVVIPFLMCVIQFLCENIVSVIAHVFMPISQLHRNSLYYSGKKSQRLPLAYRLPHFTIQMPVYKEGLDSVLAPTIESVKKAIAVYELQGGTANILVSEDGLQLLPPAEQEVRRDYYERNNVGWVARPKHGQDGYNRKGRFKKASNLNFTCHLSLRVEEIMDEKRPEIMLAEGLTDAEWFDENEKDLYRQALELAVAEQEGRAWAAGDVRIGEYILLIDSDTRVPSDCFMEAACELERSPEVGALQHCSGVMYVADHYFERMIGFFTKIVNLSISWCVANGAVSPLVGHNAFLRWRAVQEVMFEDSDGERCVWSHAHVSEDFDMALRLLMQGFIVRWATYSNNEFMEGVSLTADDEVNRWQKYAFGCSELVFNPLRYWPTRGPLSPLFRKLLWSNVPTSYKFNSCAYIFSYWAIAAGAPLTIIIFFVQGLFWPSLDAAFLPSFQVWLSTVFVFLIGGTVGHVIFRVRAGQDSFFKAAVEQIKWIPAFIVFFSGLSYHVMLALFAHITGYNMTWSATVKDVTESNFWKEIPAIFRRFWHCYLIMFLFMALMILSSLPLLPLEWRIEGFTIFWPASLMVVTHFLYPLVLNPWLMRFEF